MAKGFRNVNRRAKPQKYGVALVAVFILVALTYFTRMRTASMRFSLGNSLLLFSTRSACHQLEFSLTA